MANLHEYTVEVQWSGGLDGQGQAKAKGSGASFGLAVPPEYQGKGGATNPEELLTSAITACYSITLGIIAANRKLPITKLDVQATGVVEQNGPSLTYRSVTLKPTVTVAADASDDQVAAITDMAHKADGYCLITNAVRGKVEVTVEPTVVRD